MKKAIVFTAVVILLAFSARADNDSVSISGEIVDLHCYTSRGAHGEEHSGCGNACLSRDVPAGLLTKDGTLYLLVNEKSNSVKEKVAGNAGKMVTAKGTLVERGGMKVIQVVSID